jgi:hypothetical protein
MLQENIKRENTNDMAIDTPQKIISKTILAAKDMLTN